MLNLFQANIVDGQAEPDEERKTTLIVVPSHLATHWCAQDLMLSLPGFVIHPLTNEGSAK